jgi:hypothetical protein
MNVLEKIEVAIKNGQFRDTDKTTQNEDKQNQKIQRAFEKYLNSIKIISIKVLKINLKMCII